MPDRRDDVGRNDDVDLAIIVVPRSSREQIGPVVGDRLKVAIKAPPVDNEANRAIVALLAKQLGLRRAQLAVVAGLRSKRKTVRVQGADRSELRRGLVAAVGDDALKIV